MAVRILAADLDSDRLQAEVARLAKISDGVVGMSALHIESNRRFAFHGEDRFPMASAFKCPSRFNCWRAWIAARFGWTKW